MTMPHLCTCSDGAVVVCLCDNTKDHDESGFSVREGVWVDVPENGPDEPERLRWEENE